MKPRRTVIQVYVGPEMRRALRLRALDLDVTASEVARRAIATYLSAAQLQVLPPEPVSAASPYAERPGR